MLLERYTFAPITSRAECFWIKYLIVFISTDISKCDMISIIRGMGHVCINFLIFIEKYIEMIMVCVFFNLYETKTFFF